MTEKQSHTISNLLSVTRHWLLGEINPSLRGIAVDWEENCILIYFYHDGELNSAIEDHYSCIGTNIVASYSTATIDEHIISLKCPTELPKHNHWAYLRREPFIDPSS